MQKTLKQYRKKLIEIFIETFLVSPQETILITAFHPYATLPFRLVSTSYIVFNLYMLSQEYKRPIHIINLFWDPILPNTEKAREELYIYLPQTIPDKKEWLFEPDQVYTLQTVNYKKLICILDMYETLYLPYLQKQIVNLRRTFSYIKNIYITPYSRDNITNHIIPPHVFTLTVLKNFFKLLNINDIAHFITTRTYSFLEERTLRFLRKSILILLELYPLLYKKGKLPNHKPFLIYRTNPSIGLYPYNEEAFSVKKYKTVLEKIKLADVKPKELFWSSFTRAIIFGLLSVKEFGKRYPIYNVTESLFSDSNIKIRTPSFDFLNIISPEEEENFIKTHYKIYRNNHTITSKTVPAKNFKKPSRFMNINMFLHLYEIEEIKKRLLKMHNLSTITKLFNEIIDEPRY